MKIKKMFLALLSVAFVAPLVSLANDFNDFIGARTGWGSFLFWSTFLGVLLLVIAGILVVIWLFKQIGKK